MGQRSVEDNPFNHERRIELVDRNGKFLYKISQIVAFRLLRAGVAELLLRKPPAIQLTIPTEEHAAFCGKVPTSYGKHKNFLHARRTVLYGNYHVESPQGRVMFHCSNQKVLWYLNRDLVDIVSDDPPTVRFKFLPNGPGHVGDEYYLTTKVNRCVVCGTTHGLNRHHVLPYCFRRFMPEEIKDHSYHDVLLMCLDCHERYEGEANKFKVELGQQFGVSLNDGGGALYDPDVGKTVKAARAIIRHGEKIPQPRLDELYQHLRDWYGKDDITQAELEAAAELKAWSKPEGYVEFGEFIVSQVDPQEFAERWREHFVETMQPQFLPQYWSVERPIQRLN